MPIHLKTLVRSNCTKRAIRDINSTVTDQGAPLSPIITSYPKYQVISNQTNVPRGKHLSPLQDVQSGYRRESYNSRLKTDSYNKSRDIL